MHLLFFMNVMLDFIGMGFAGLWRTGRKRKFQHENMSRPGIEPETPRFATWRFRPFGHADVHVHLTWCFLKICIGTDATKNLHFFYQCLCSLSLFIYRYLCMNILYNNQFGAYIIMRVDFLHMPRLCKSFKHIFFNPPAHLCAVTSIIEISLHVTLSHYHSHSL